MTVTDLTIDGKLFIVHPNNNALIIIVVIITWPEKFDFVLGPEHDVTGILA